MQETQESRLNGRLPLRRRLFDNSMRAIIWLCAGLATLLVLLLIGYILYRGVPSITWQLLSSQESYLKNTIGILPSILNTLYIIIVILFTLSKIYKLLFN